MSKLNLFLFTGIMLCITTCIEAQDLQLSHDSKSMTFKTGTLIRVDIPPGEGVLCDPCKNNFVVGRIISYNNDTLTLRIRFENEPIMKGEKEIGSKHSSFNEKNEQDWPVIEIPRKNIYSVTKQGTKKWKPINGGDMMGAAFTTVGLISLLAFVAEGEENNNVLLGTGIGMTAAGLIMITVFDRKAYHMETSPNKTVRDKVWIIR